MLGACIPECLTAPRESRHEFQEDVVRMIGIVLAKEEESLQAAVEAATSKLEEVTGQKDERAKASEDAVQDLRSREEATSAAQTAAAKAADAVWVAGEALAAAEKELAASQKETAAVEAKRALLASALNDKYLPIKGGSAEPAKVREGLAALVSLGKDFSMDQTLLDALPCAVGKAPSDRGSFDDLVLQQLEAELERCTSAVKETLATAESSKKECEEKVANAAAEAGKVKSAVEETKASLAAAKVAQKEALAAKRDLAKALQQWGPELKQAAAALNSSRESLEEFRKGPLASFKALVDHTLVTPGGSVPAGTEADAAPAE